MKVAFFSAKPYEKSFFEEANHSHQYSLNYLDIPLNVHTANLAKGADVVCIFVNDKADAKVIKVLAQNGIQLIALRCAGYNNVDLSACREEGIQVVRVPAYSPYSVAEHTIALILTLNRKTHRAYNRVKEGNFSLDGLMGFDLHGKTVGMIGLGKIGFITAQILKGFGCRVLGYDIAEDKEAKQIGVEYVSLQELLRTSDIISLHCPLTPQTHHIINKETISQMKKGVMIINTGRGALIDAKAAIRGLKNEQIGYMGLDVYEEEADLFFEDLSEKVIKDDVFMRLLTFPNVLITGHQAFFTQNAMHNIAETTLQNIHEYEQKLPLTNQVKV
ncbi:2-hydroxyacid dehydrogenase [Cytophagaceae bacterium YF14B1]|uniref:2-hydroxyacid dehydrogenase n=1 Tax=Xanthocytophaga flava TaxID=3048013 RepID=A0AAE3QNN1_9BACT|nr:2-hydroxyacid dehydrogenase [Xanthocytophaga flavus]MDJ1482016.1 2-hydroxyacid dehydrogenase [Xanthocytophaga flavus]